MEITRGCGLGCDFCTLAREPMRHLPVETILADARTNLNAGVRNIALITEDADSLKEELVANSPSPITYANPNMPKEVLEEDLIIQTFPLDVLPEKVRFAPSSEFFQNKGVPEKE